MSNQISNFERQSQILQFLQRNQRISIDEIRTTFTVSEATARRDLEMLASEGKLQRVHGGAVILPHTQSESPLLQRQNTQPNEKLRIGQAAAALIEDGETIFLGSGTTVLEVARALTERRGIQVITNSLPVINVLACVGGVPLICMGGMLRESELSFIGHITEQALAEIHVDKVFLGTPAISLEYGMTHEYLPETITDRAILKIGQQNIVLADHTKIGRTATVVLAPLKHIHTLVTDKLAPSDFIDALRKEGIQVVLA